MVYGPYVPAPQSSLRILGMYVKRFFEPKLAQASYLIGCQGAKEAIVIDPNRDTDQYLAEAEAAGVVIRHVTETHIHADYLSGSRELARRTGATLYLSDEGDENWKYGFVGDGNVTLVRNGDRITVGNILIDVVHTPGHTPEHITFLVTDGAAADEPIAAATGDFIFVGDVCAVVLWFLDHPGVSGIYNLGTGRSQTFNDVANAVIDWHGRGAIRYVPFPDHLRGSYQSFTEADLTRLRAIGYESRPTSLEDGISKYLEWRHA